MEKLTEKQKAARQLITDYGRYLFDQEALVQRIVERKWKEESAKLEELIEAKVQEIISRNSAGHAL